MTEPAPYLQPGAGLVGTPVRRREDLSLLTGGAAFLDDLNPEGVLHAAFVRSADPHADVLSVDATEAREMRGVELVLTADDIWELPPLLPIITRPGARAVAHPILAGARARFVGEPIALVVAANRYIAEDAAEAVDVTYQPRRPSSSIEAALTGDADPLHDEIADNLLYVDLLERGDVDRAFDGATVVVERTYRTARLCAAPIEGRGALAMPEGRGLAVWSSTQIPHVLQQTIAATLGLRPDDVRVICPDIGGGFGQKVNVYPEEVLVALAALRTQATVKWTEDRSENFLAGSHARDQRVSLRAAAGPDGRLLALDATVHADVGAYGGYPFGQILEALGTPMILPGPYDVQTYRCRTHAVATNKSPQGPYRGVGIPVAVLVLERTMDVLAEELGIDRAEIRRRNFIRPEDFPYTTATELVYDSGRYGEALDRALEAIDYDSFPARRDRAGQEGRLLGLGFASYVEWTGTNSEVYRARGMVQIDGYDAARVAVSPDGIATVWTSCPAIGQGVDTTFSQLVADELQLPLHRVRAEHVDTSRAPRGSGTFASRSAIGGGGAIIGVATVLRHRLFDLAAEELEASASDLELRDGLVRVKGSPAKALSIAELAQRADEGHLDVREVYDAPDSAYPYATHACVVEVCPETCEVTLLRYVVVEDCGRVINPLIVEGQVQGATAQGIAGALYESMIYDEDGQPVTASLMDYLVPTAGEIPWLDIHHMCTPAPHLRGGFKGVGEGGSVAPPAAICNAVSNALGVEINQTPVTPDVVRAALGDRQTGVAAS